MRRATSRGTSIRFVGVLLALLLAVGVSGSAQFRDGVEFEELVIGDMRVEFYQRQVGDAIVEGDYIVRQYDVESGELVKEIIEWRSDLPEELPLTIGRDEAIERVGGDVAFAELYYLADGSPVHPVYSPNPCWVIDATLPVDRSTQYVTSSVVDAVTGELLGRASPPPQYFTGFSLTGPECQKGTTHCATGPGSTTATGCAYSWDAWYQNAATWFNTMGYSTLSVRWPTENEVKTQIANNYVAVFYELAHGGSTSFCSGCVGGTSYEATTAAEVKSWISPYPPFRFAFIGSCGGMCSTGPGTLSYEFRKGSSEGTATTGYCHMDSPTTCAKDCWHAGHTIGWQTSLFKYLNQGYSVKQAFDKANADRPFCAKHSCMRFAGDPDLSLVPGVQRSTSSSTGQVTPRLPDLRVLPETIWDILGPYLQIEIWVGNESRQGINEPILISVFLDGDRIRSELGPELPGGETAVIPIEFEAPEGRHTVEIVLDPMNEIEEVDEENNVFVFEYEY